MPPSQRTKQTLLGVAGTLIAAAGTGVYLRYRRDMKAARARVSSGSTLVNTSYGPIEYADVGTGLPVLVIHGAGGGFDQGLEFAGPLIELGFRVIAPSRFGYLRTPLPPDASPVAQADAHARLLDALHVDKVAVMGVSAGAPSAVQLCLRHPERCTSLVLGVPLAYSTPPAGALPERPSAFKTFLLDAMLSSDFAYWILSKLAPNAMIKTVLGTPPEDAARAGAKEQDRLIRFLDLIEPISKRKQGLENESAIAQSLERYDLERCRVPTLVFAVKNCLYNTYAGARYTAAHIPGARFVSYSTGGHLCVGHQSELWSEIWNFLESAEKEQLAVSS